MRKQPDGGCALTEIFPKIGIGGHVLSIVQKTTHFKGLGVRAPLGYNKASLEDVMRILFIGWLLSWMSIAQAYTIELTAADVQMKVSEMSPIVLQKKHATVTLLKPMVTFVEPNRVAVRAQVLMEYKLVTTLRFGNESTWVGISGVPRYDAGTGAFYLEQLVVDDVQHAGLSPKLQGELKKFLEVQGQAYLQHHPIYTLNQSLQQTLIRHTLQRVTIERQRLRIELGL